MQTITETIDVYEWAELDSSAQDRARVLFAEWASDDASDIAEWALDWTQEKAAEYGITIDSAPYWAAERGRDWGAAMNGSVTDLARFMSHQKIDEHMAGAILAAVKRGRLEIDARLSTGRTRWTPSTESTAEVYDDRDERRVKYTEIMIMEAIEAALRDAVQDIEHHFLGSIEKEYEWHMSDEYITEMCEANDYRFTEHGELA